MKVFWTEGSGRVRGKREEDTSGGCLLPRAKVSSDSSDPPSIALSRPRALSLLALSLSFAATLSHSNYSMSEFQTLVHRGLHQNLRPHGLTIPDKRSRAGRNVLFHSHEREQPALPRVDPVAYKDQNEIVSQLTIDA